MILSARKKYKFQVTGISLTKPGLTAADAKPPIFKLNAKIDSVPTFLRINSILMAPFLPSITQFLSLLQKFTYTDSVKFCCACTNIGRGPRFKGFSRYSHFLSCLSTKVLPILDGHTPHFNLRVYSEDETDTTSLIGSILKLPQVQASSNVKLYIKTSFKRLPHRSLQIDGISDWLNRQYAGPQTNFCSLTLQTGNNPFG